jgi:hypothetical protein
MFTYTSTNRRTESNVVEVLTRGPSLLRHLSLPYTRARLSAASASGGSVRSGLIGAGGGSKTKETKRLLIQEPTCVEVHVPRRALLEGFELPAPYQQCLDHPPPRVLPGGSRRLRRRDSSSSSNTTTCSCFLFARLNRVQLVVDDVVGTSPPSSADDARGARDAAGGERHVVGAVLRAPTMCLRLTLFSLSPSLSLSSSRSFCLLKGFS